MELGLAYQIEPWVGVEFALPIRVTHLDVTFRDMDGQPMPSFESIHHQTETLVGLGDFRFGALFQLLKPGLVQGLRVTIGAGFELPTGHIEPDPFELGRQGKSHQHMFFGSGTVNPYGSLALNYRMPWFGLSMFGRISGAVYDNRYGYRGPTLVFAGIMPSTDFGIEKVRLLAGVELVHEEAASWAGTPAENSGRTDLLAAVGIQWQVDPSWGLMLTGRVPVYNRSLGGQLEAPFYASLGVTFQTPSLKNRDHLHHAAPLEPEVLIEDEPEVLIEDEPEVLIEDEPEVLIEDEPSLNSDGDETTNPTV